MGKPKLSSSTSGGSIIEKVENQKWTPQMDDVLIAALEHQTAIGNRVNGTFTTTAYENVVKELAEKLGREFNKQHVKNRLKTIKTNFNECYDIFKGGMSGFSWNPSTNAWDAEPEVWKSFIEAKPEAKKWMNTPMPNYEKLAKLFGKDRATGLGAETAMEKSRRWSMESENLENVSEGGTTIEDLDADEHVSIESFSYMSNHHSRPTTPNEAIPEAPTNSTSSNSKKRKATFSLDNPMVNEALSSIAMGMLNGNEIMRERNEILRKSQPRAYTEEEIYDELVRLGVDSTIRMEGYCFLIDNPSKARAFFGCPNEERVQFLLIQLSKAGAL